MPTQNPDVSQTNCLENKVTLIIHGMNERGRALATLLAQRGSDVVIVDDCLTPELAHCIQQEVEALGCRCLVITPDTSPPSRQPFPQQAINIILENFGRLDLFVSYAKTPATVHLAPPIWPQTNGSHTLPRNGHGVTLQKPKTELFDESGLVQAAIDQIFIAEG